MAKNRSLYIENRSCREKSNALKRVCFDDDERLLICGRGSVHFAKSKVTEGRKRELSFLPNAHRCAAFARIHNTRGYLADCDVNNCFPRNWKKRQNLMLWIQKKLKLSVRIRSNLLSFSLSHPEN